MPASLDISLAAREALRQRERARLTNLRPRIAEICARYGVAKLSVFGSLLHAGEFGPDSDFDFLVEFAPDVKYGLGDLVEIEMELEELLGRRVDLRTAMGLSRYFREEVAEEAEVFYAAS